MYIMVDVESDGPCPGLYSMVSFGAVLCSDPSKTFYGETKHISDKYILEALAISNITRNQHSKFPNPAETMLAFEEWIKNVCGSSRPFFISDNNGFDWQFINYYFHAFVGHNPFGFSSTNLGSLYKGMQKDVFVNFKHLRKTKHTHHPVDDSIGNVEALIEMKRMGLKINL